MRNDYSNRLLRTLGLVAGALVIGWLGVSAQTKNKNEGSTKTTTRQQMSEPTGFYCNARALSKDERKRYSELIEHLAHSRAEIKELPDGYAFRLQSSVPIGDLALWVSYERKCCPFFTFEIELEGNGGPLWLKLRGAEGVKPFIREEFGVT